MLLVEKKLCDRLAQHRKAKGMPQQAGRRANQDLAKTTTFDGNLCCQNTLQLWTSNLLGEFQAVMKKINITFKDYLSVNYMDTLIKLLPMVQDGDALGNAIVVPFILMCAAALEARLNDEIVSWSYNRLGFEHYKPVADAYLSMSLRGKLNAIVPMLSNGKFLFIKHSIDYISLSRLITHRNSLIHNKAFYETSSMNAERDMDYEDLDNIKTFIYDDILEKLMQSPFRSSTAKDCQLYYSALNSIDKHFFLLLDQNRLSENDMIARSSDI